MDAESRDAIQQLNVQVQDLRREVDRIGEMVSQLITNVGSLRDSTMDGFRELREEMDTRLGELRVEMHTIRDELRSEMYAIRDELRLDMKRLDEKIDLTRAELKSDIAVLRHDLKAERKARGWWQAEMGARLTSIEMRNEETQANSQEPRPRHRGLRRRSRHLHPTLARTWQGLGARHVCSSRSG